MEYILETYKLSKRYGSVQAVQELSLKIPKGSVFGLLGPNGSGKTTTLGMILGVLHPTSGNFSWFGQALNFSAKKKIGAILENPNFYPYLSGYSNLKLIADIKEVDYSRIDEVLTIVNLHERAKSKFKTYSLGMKQRLAIAGALLSDPEVMVLDEPTNGLDPQGIAEIRQLIKEIAERNITVILASHLLDEVEKVCTDAAVLRKGELLFSGGVHELTGHEGLMEVSCRDNERLFELLQQHPAIKTVQQEADMLHAMLKENLDAEELNKYLIENGIYVNHLVFRKQSLESKFLNLVKA